MRMRCMLIGFICCLLPVSVSAEFYRYTDENGVIHFTDNYIEIPDSYQSKAHTLTDPDDNLTPEEKAQRERSLVEISPKTEAEIKAAREAERLQRFESLNKTKAGLDQTYAGLLAEKKALEKEGQTVKPEDMKAYRERVIRFNQRRADYEKQSKTFQIKADAYNKEIAKQ